MNTSRPDDYVPPERAAQFAAQLAYYAEQGAKLAADLMRDSLERIFGTTEPAEAPEDGEAK